LVAKNCRIIYLERPRLESSSCSSSLQHISIYVDHSAWNIVSGSERYFHDIFICAPMNVFFLHFSYIHIPAPLLEWGVCQV
jgi:hypothetical protein